MSRLIRTDKSLQELVFWPGVDLLIDSISTHLPVLFFRGFVSLKWLVERGVLIMTPQCFRLAEVSNVITLVIATPANFQEHNIS